MSANLLDAKGLTCPLPILRTRKALKDLAPGALLEVQATDPGSMIDFKSYCEKTGDELVEAREEDGVFIFRIRKKV